MRQARIARVWMAALILSCATAASAQNAVTNGDFNAVDGIDGWGPYFYMTWSYNAAIDANICEWSGSSHGTPYPTFGTPPWYFEVWAPGCLSLSPGQNIYVDFQHLSNGLEWVGAELYFFTSTDCTGSGSFNYGYSFAGVADWTPASMLFTNPANASSVVLVLNAWNNTDFSFQLAFDRVYMGTAERIFADDFEGGGSPFGVACRWSFSTP